MDLNLEPNESFELPPTHWIFYIHSMLFNTRAALESRDVVIEALKIFELPHKLRSEDVNQDLILDSLHSMITHASILSKFLWPVSKNRIAQKRGEYLRDLLQVDDRSPIKNNILRNHLQHFDEKLDKYLHQHFVGVWYPSHVGPDIDTQGIPTHIFRAFYVYTGVFQVLDVRFPIQPIADEVLRLHHSLEAIATSGRRKQ